MSLSNLLAIQRLQEFKAAPQGVQRLLAAAERNLADAGLPALSPENRFDAAYKCIMQCATIGLWAHGYRTPTSQTGHHQTTLQCLSHTLGVPTEVLIVLDALRKRRNQNDYEGDPVSPAAVAECRVQAQDLLARTRRFLQTEFPHLIGLPP